MKYEHKDTSVRKPQKAGRCGTSQFVQILSQPNKLRHEVPAFTSLCRLESQTLAFIFSFPQKGWKPAGLNPLKKGWLARVRGWLTVLEYLSQYSATTQPFYSLPCLFTVFVSKAGTESLNCMKSQQALLLAAAGAVSHVIILWAPSPFNLQRVNTFLQLYIKSCNLKTDVCCR